MTGTTASRRTELGKRLSPAVAAGALVVWGLTSHLLPALPDGANVMLSTAISLALMGVIVWGLLPLGALGRRLPFLAAAVLLFAVPLVWLGLIPFANLAKIIGAAALGLWIAEEIEHRSWIVIVAVVSAATDVVSVAMGPTEQILEAGPTLIGYFTVAMTWLGYTWREAQSEIGVSDVIFFALYLGTAHRFGLRERWSAVAMIASFLVTMALALGWRALPGLPLLSLAFLMVNADLLWRGPRRGADDDPAARPAPF